jgi:hypothetical protein
MMRTLIAVLAVLLAGCATAPPAPHQPPLVDIREIQGPPKIIKEPCINPSEITPLPAPATPPRGTPGSEADIVVGLALDATRFAEIAKKQQKQLQDCSKLSPEVKK